jgi:pimeloyl-ACP methyl ester carboxylesterase
VIERNRVMHTAGRHRRRRAAILWTLFGVAMGMICILASRRRRFVPFGDWDSDSELSRDDRAPSSSADHRSVATWIGGPAGNLRVRDTGPEDDLPAVVFLHGLAGNGGQWTLQIDHLQGRRRTIAIDLRGHGESDPAEGEAYSIAGLAADVAAVADQLMLRRFVLVGHSLGAAVAIHFAATHPQRVEGLLLVDPNGDQTRLPATDTKAFLESLCREPVQELERYFRQLLVGGDRDASSWVLDDLRLTDEAAIVGLARASIGYSPLGDLARYPGPTLAVISQLNQLPISLHRLIDDLPVQYMTGTGHWLMMDRPAAFNHVLDDFLEHVDEAASETGA